MTTEDQTNDERVRRGQLAIDQHMELTNDCVPEDALTDVLGDLMHYCHEHEDLNFEAALAVARNHFEYELDNPGL